jgi:hypothetical protein
MANLSDDLFDHTTNIDHKDIKVATWAATSPVGVLTDLARTLQELGFALVVWYDEEGEALRMKAVPQRLGS